MNQISFGTREFPFLIPEKLKEMIVEKGLKLGDRLPSEGKLAVIFGVGHSTVRETVRLSIADNIVEIHRGRGIFITESPGLKSDPLGLHSTSPNKLLQDLLGNRPPIELQIARLTARRAASENLYRLGQAVEEMEIMEHVDGLEYPFRDVDFYTTTTECTQNDALERILSLVCELTREDYLEMMNIPGTHQRAITAYIRIFEVIRDRNSGVTAEEVRRHTLQAMGDPQFKYQEE